MGKEYILATKKTRGLPPTDAFATLYPNIARWVQDSWIEVGRDDCNRSFVRVLDIGGLVWEGKASYPNVHEAMVAAEAACLAWFEENHS